MATPSQWSWGKIKTQSGVHTFASTCLTESGTGLSECFFPSRTAPRLYKDVITGNEFCSHKARAPLFSWSVLATAATALTGWSLTRKTGAPSKGTEAPSRLLLAPRPRCLDGEHRHELCPLARLRELPASWGNIRPLPITFTALFSASVP